MSGVARARTHEEIRRFLAIGAVQVAELDLEGEGGSGLRPGPSSPPVTHGEVFLLVRRAGRPGGHPADAGTGGSGPAHRAGAGDRAGHGRAPEHPAAGADAGTTRKAGGRRRMPGRRPGRAGAREQTRTAARENREDEADGGAVPYVSVVVATRERAGQLARALDSLLAQEHPRFEIVVVDNAPATGATRELVQRAYGERVRYVREPVPGWPPTTRGWPAARGEVIAFTDDDVVADPRWLTELTAPFAADPRLGCATGLILPARLRTPAQVLLESHGGFAKGFAPTTYDPGTRPATNRCSPSPRAASAPARTWRSVRRCCGPSAASTRPPAPGRPRAAVTTCTASCASSPAGTGCTTRRTRWCGTTTGRPGRTWRPSEYGYSTPCTTAYLTAILVGRPALLPAFLARLPRGLAHARALTAVRDTDGGGAPGAHGTRAHPWPRRLSRLQRRGMVYGPLGYLRARRAPGRTAGRATG
ncbi:hypothetical protein MAUB1S_03879 [Mycolicibacterium aubagnense]